MLIVRQVRLLLIPDDVVIHKRTPDAFHDTPLQSELQAKGIKALILVGMQTELCIAATCHRAAELGYEVTLVADCHSTFDSHKLTAAEAIRRYNQELASCARVVTKDQVEF